MIRAGYAHQILFFLGLMTAATPLMAGMREASSELSLQNEVSQPYRMSRLGFRSVVDAGLLISAPEGTGIEVQYQPWRHLAFWSLYTWPLDARVNLSVSSQSLVDKEGLRIRSPDLELPFDINFGPHKAIGMSFFPFGGSFYLSGGYAKRTVTIHSLVESQLEFGNDANAAMTNTIFRASVATQTEQDLLRASIGQRWAIARSKLYISWFLGANSPLRASSSLAVDVQVRNPRATDPNEKVADNLTNAVEDQREIISRKVEKELSALERKKLPMLGLGIGWRW